MPTFQKYKLIISAFILTSLPILLPLFLNISARTNKGGYLTMFLWILCLVISLILAIKSFRQSLVRIPSIVIIIADLVMIAQITVLILWASSF